MNGDLVALPVHLLDRGVIGVLVRHKERGFDITTVRVFALGVENLLVKADVVVVDGVVEGYRDHLRYVFAWEIAGYRRTVLRAEAIRQDAHSGVARRSSIRIIIHVWNIKEIAIVPKSKIRFKNSLLLFFVFF